MCVQLTADRKPTSRANRAAGVNTASKHQRCLNGENRMARPAHTAQGTRHASMAAAAAAAAVAVAEEGGLTDAAGCGG